MLFCKNCGAQLKANAKYCSSCGNPCNETTAEEKTQCCKKCNALLDADAMFCPECGEPCHQLDEYEEIDVSYAAEENEHNNMSRESPVNVLNLLLLLGCLALWLIAPFMAINLLTYGDQPTALQLVTDDVLYIGELTDSDAFWVAVISLAGISICLISTIAKANRVTHVVSAITELLFAVLIALVVLAYRFDDIEEIFGLMGVGFWGIFILLFIVFCNSGSKPSKG